MWLAVFCIFHQSVYSGICSAGSWSAEYEYVDRSWLGFWVSFLVVTMGSMIQWDVAFI